VKRDTIFNLSPDSIGQHFARSERDIALDGINDGEV
jgi:hypothetical protein